MARINELIAAMETVKRDAAWHSLPAPIREKVDVAIREVRSLERALCLSSCARLALTWTLRARALRASECSSRMPLLNPLFIGRRAEGSVQFVSIEKRM